MAEAQSRTRYTANALCYLQALRTVDLCSRRTRLSHLRPVCDHFVSELLNYGTLVNAVAETYRGYRVCRPAPKS